jgi:hypothetical protein
MNVMTKKSQADQRFRVKQVIFYMQARKRTIPTSSERCHEVELCSMPTGTADFMAFVRAGRAFGDQWEVAVERERQAHKRMQRVLNSPLACEKQDP